MYVRAELTTRSFDLVEAHDCQRFHVEVVGTAGAGDGRLRELAETIGPTGRVESADVVWISVDDVRRMARLCVDSTWATDFEAMIEYAAGKGWLDDERTHLQAHVEWVDVADSC